MTLCIYAGDDLLLPKFCSNLVALALGQCGTQPFFWKKINTVAMDVSKHSPRVKSRLSLSKPTKTLSKLPAPLDEHSSFNTS